MTCDLVDLNTKLIIQLKWISILEFHKVKKIKKCWEWETFSKLQCQCEGKKKTLVSTVG